ncbi:MAG: molybdenum cofactor biosynthesis protein MoaE [Acetobacteraceae bacterium]|nr:molybdenum cofactor biosynthesis protein MoaE [Acetobacteraceae bacterium]
MRVAVQSEAFDPADLLRQLTADRSDAGGVVSFTGLVRADRDDAVAALELQSYPGFTEAAIGAAAEAVVRDLVLLDLVVVHRIGRMAPGEPIVFVGAAATHRRAAFQGADRMMDYLKTSAPFWKLEHVRTGERRWIEPRAEDHADAARWASPPEQT